MASSRGLHIYNLDLHSRNCIRRYYTLLYEYLMRCSKDIPHRSALLSVKDARHCRIATSSCRLVCVMRRLTGQANHPIAHCHDRPDDIILSASTLLQPSQ